MIDTVIHAKKTMLTIFDTHTVLVSNIVQVAFIAWITHWQVRQKRITMTYFTLPIIKLAIFFLYAFITVCSVKFNSIFYSSFS